MPTTLTALGEEHVGWLPRHLQGSIDIIASLDALAREGERWHDEIEDVGLQLFIQTATWGLGYWEQLIQFTPIFDENDPDLEDRRLQAVAKFRSNVAQSGLEYRAVIDSFISNYTIQMDHDTATLNITFSYNPAGYLAPQLEAIIRTITPAHLNLNFQYTGFLLGISELGDSL